jgi:transcriptional regulator with XRE-family HTH domain
MARVAQRPSPLPVVHALRKLGDDVRTARRRRRIPVELLAERADIARMTLHKIEKGDSGVAIGNYAAVLFSLGMLERLADVADPRFDLVGLELDKESLPKRIRLPRR